MKMHSPNQTAAIARLFSPSVIKELAGQGKSSLFARLAKEARSVIELDEGQRVFQFFDKAFDIFKKTEYRHEYIYKAALTQRVLLGTYSLRTAAMLNEFRVGGCKADLAILNGTATVYEIKSERDSLSRLEHQIETYKQFFAAVYVIAGDNHLEGIRSIASKDVGILRLSPRHQISTLRAARDRPDRTSPAVIYESLRKEEAKQILKLMNLSIPDVPNTEMHGALRERFLKLTAQDAHKAMVQVLKKTRNLQPLSRLIEKLPNSLHSAALSIPLRREDHNRLVDAVNTPLRTAIQWG